MFCYHTCHTPLREDYVCPIESVSGTMQDTWLALTKYPCRNSRTNEWMDGEWMNEYNGFWNLVQFYLVTIPCCDSIDEAPKSPTNNHVGGSELILSATSISNGNNNVQN